MTRDNSNKTNDEGEPGYDIEPADVIKCRECGGMVRRVNQEHLGSDRCLFAARDRKDAYNSDGAREDLKRKDHPTTVDEYKEKYPGAPTVSPRMKANMRNRAVSEKADNRRRELVKRRWQGESMTNIVESLANRYDVAEGTIWADWSDRDEWMGRAFGLDDAESVVLESLAQKKDVRQRLMQVARQAEDQNEINSAIRALKAIDANIDDTIEHQQSLGNVAQAAQEHNVNVEGSVEHEHTAGPGEELDEETLAQLDDLTGGDEAEVVDAEFREVDE